MKYFKVEVNENYVSPVPIGWHGVIDKKTLEKKLYHLVKVKHLIFFTDVHMQMMFTDVLVFPCFMVSEKVKHVILKYEPLLNFLRIILFDLEHKQSMAYYLPCLEKAGKIKHEDGWDKKDIQNISVEKRVVNGKAIEEIVDEGGTSVIMRMDLVESILRRGAVGIGLQEVHVK